MLKISYFREILSSDRLRFAWARRAVGATVLLVTLWTGVAVQGVAAASSSTVPPRSAGKQATYGTQTATATKPDGRGYFDFGATPGGQVLDHLAVLNYSLQPITPSIRGADALHTPQGGFSIRPVDQPSKDIGRWIEVRTNDLSVNLAPRSSVIIPFEVIVPKGASPGDHVGAITATLQSSVVSKSGQRVRLLQTVGTRIFLRVSGPLHPRLSVQNLHVDYSGTFNPIGTGRAELTYSVKNTGNVALGGRQTVTVTGLFGARKVAVRVSQVPLLLPGSSIKQTVRLEGIVPEVLDKGRVAISPLVVPGSVQPPSGPYVATVTFWAVPWTLVAIVGVIILIVVRLLLRRRKRRKTARAGAHASPPDQPGAGGGEQRRVEGAPAPVAMSEMAKEGAKG